MKVAPSLFLSLVVAGVAAQVAAQGPVSAEEARRSTRLAWVRSVVAPVELRVDHGTPSWQSAYEAEVARERAARRFRLGNGGWATLHSGAVVRVGERRLPPGIWYLALERSDDAKWSLLVYESAKVLRHGALPGDLHAVEPALAIPLRREAVADAQSTLELQLVAPDGAEAQGPPSGACSLRMTWGKHRFVADLAVELELAEPADEAPAFRALDPKRALETASGLRYEVLRDGVGAAPGPTDRVRVHYVGWLEDGTKIDSSIDRKQVAAFGVHQVIAGWTEALQHMNPGAVLLIEIPPALGYGVRGAPPKVPADATLFFWVELFAVEK